MKMIDKFYKRDSNGSYYLWTDGYNAEYGWCHHPDDPSGYLVYRGTLEDILPEWEEKKTKALVLI